MAIFFGERVRGSANVDVSFFFLLFGGNNRRLQSSALATAVFALRFAALTLCEQENEPFSH